MNIVRLIGFAGLFLFGSFSQPLFAQLPPYLWLAENDPGESVLLRILPPDGYERDSAASGSYADWLRNLPLQVGRPAVKLYNGQLKGNQSVHEAVLNLDVGKKDLQQCADAVMRLRAEYLLACGAYPNIHFNFTSGDNAEYTRWKQGYRPRIQGNAVRWEKRAQPSDSYESFRKYMEIVFSYAGTHSLDKELQTVASVADLQAGDVFIQGGFPGHAVAVIDVAIHPESGQKLFLLAQSYMPAQEMHILRNPNDSQLSPWYALPESTLYTPEWTFGPGTLKRFVD